MEQSMSQAIKILESKHAEWMERGEYHRQEAMKAHVAGDYEKRDEERKELDKVADIVSGLNYAIALLCS